MKILYLFVLVVFSISQATAHEFGSAVHDHGLLGTTATVLVLLSMLCLCAIGLYTRRRELRVKK